MMAGVINDGLKALLPSVRAILCAMAVSTFACSTLNAQEIIVTADVARVSVGGQVAVQVETRLGKGAQLVERMPRPFDSLPEGVRVVSEDSLKSSLAGTYVARIRLAFFRPGVASVPALALAYRTSTGASDTLRSHPLPIEVLSSLPPGNQPMRDIKDLEPLTHRTPATRLFAIGAAAALLVLLLLATVRRAHRVDSQGTEENASPPPVAIEAQGPYGRALSQLMEIEQAQWPTSGQVTRHFERVTEILRQYLTDQHHIRATDRTTAELVWSLPPFLSEDGQREECRALLEEADLVKFARARPDALVAENFLSRARSLLNHWHVKTASVCEAAISVDGLS